MVSLPHACDPDSEAFLVVRYRREGTSTLVYWYCPECLETGTDTYIAADRSGYYDFYAPYDR